jgi:hypothetical protein
LKRLDEEIGSWWSRCTVLSLDERLTKREDQQKMYVPQAVFPCPILRNRVKSMQACHEFIVVKQVH